MRRAVMVVVTVPPVVPLPVKNTTRTTVVAAKEKRSGPRLASIAAAQCGPSVDQVTSLAGLAGLSVLRSKPKNVV